MYENKISIIGTGYVGLVAGVCLADFGNNIINVDIDEEKIKKLQNKKMPLYERGLKEIFDKNIEEKRISFTTKIEKAIGDSQVIFIAVGTPSNGDGSADLNAVKKVAKTIGNIINEYKVIVNKSTVPVGTAKKVKNIIQDQLEKREKNISFDVVSNPEFLREGKAIYDFTHPDRIVIGSNSKKAKKIMQNVYRALYLNNVPFVFTSPQTAELIKYASNAFLATKISFINEMSILCDKVDGNIQTIAKTMGMDGRIGDKFLHAGPGYGGSCFPKDTKAIVKTAGNYGLNLRVIQAGIEANKKQKMYMVEKIENYYETLEGKKLGILGLSFKPETDDMRESASLTILPELIKKGVKIMAYDPEAIKVAKCYFKNFDKDIIYCDNEYEVMKNADGLVLLTEWNQFRRLDLNKVKELLKQPIFFDFRNVYKKDEIKEYGLNYIGVGIGNS